MGILCEDDEDDIEDDYQAWCDHCGDIGHCATCGGLGTVSGGSCLDCLGSGDCPECHQFKQECRRLRLILTGIARAGGGQGTIIELTGKGDNIELIVCRADVDELEFFRQIQDGLHKLAAIMEGQIEIEKLRRIDGTNETKESET